MPPDSTLTAVPRIPQTAGMNTAGKNYSDVESRRSRASRRRMSAGRRLYYLLGLPLLRGAIRLLTASYRIVGIRGEEFLHDLADSGRSCAPCYWHQQHILCSTLIRRHIRRGFKACFLVSGSVDGEVPARIAQAWGAEVIRGSANQSGALALRDMQAMMRRGYSIVTTADGPRGPLFEFKAGAVLMARIGAVPIVPVGCAAEKAWSLNRWDRFMIPKPFSRVAIVVGEPQHIPADTPLDELEPHRLRVQQAVMSAMQECSRMLHEK